jgi:hypothetical protein
MPNQTLGRDEDMTALLWAAGAYVPTFTPTLLLLRGRAQKDAFAQRQSIVPNPL